MAVSIFAPRTDVPWRSTWVPIMNPGMRRRRGAGSSKRRTATRSARPCRPSRRRARRPRWLGCEATDRRPARPSSLAKAVKTSRAYSSFTWNRAVAVDHAFQESDHVVALGGVGGESRRGRRRRPAGGVFRWAGPGSDPPHTRSRAEPTRWPPRPRSTRASPQPGTSQCIRAPPISWGGCPRR